MSWLRDWSARRQALAQAPKAQRWVVIDVETSGLDMRRDRLIAAAAVAVHLGSGKPVLQVQDSLEVVLQAPPDLPLDAVARRNILLHGIGRGEQGQGLAPVDALQRLLAFADGAPCLAFHADFDATMLDRAAQAHLGHGWPLPWLDLAALAPALHPELPHRALDDWLHHFNLQAGTRHRASSDAWVTAELLQRLWPRLMQQAPAGSPPWVQAQQWLAARRWLA